MKDVRLVEVYYRGGDPNKKYNYIYKGKVSVGDTVLVPLGKREKHATVTKTYPIGEVIRVVDYGVSR